MPATPMKIDWFLAQLKPNCANIADKNLIRQGFTTFLPKESVSRQRNNKFTSRLEPMFPGYIFVELDVTKGHWRAVNATQGVTKLVSFGQCPAPVPNEIVTQLMLRCDEDGQLLPPDLPSPGDEVTIITGPFANIVAEIQAVDADRRVWLLMDIMGRSTRVAARSDQLKAV